MRKANVTILASILAIALVAAGVGAGTMAWFSAVPQDTGTITMNAATMEMEMTTQIYTFDDLIPGQEFGPIEVRIKNDGTMDIGYLGIDWIIDGIAYPDSLDPVILEFADKIHVTSINERVGGVWKDSMQDPQNYWNLVGDKELPLTLLELAQSYHSGEPDWAEGRKRDQFGGWVGTTTDAVTGSGYDVHDPPAIKVGETYIMHMSFKFSEDAGNDLQGKSMSFYIKFTGTQHLSTLP